MMSDSTQQNSGGSLRALKDRVRQKTAQVHQKIDHGPSKFNLSSVGESISRGVENIKRSTQQFKPVLKVQESSRDIIELDSQGYEVIDVGTGDGPCRIFIAMESESDPFDDGLQALQVTNAPMVVDVVPEKEVEVVTADPVEVELVSSTGKYETPGMLEASTKDDVVANVDADSLFSKLKEVRGVHRDPEIHAQVGINVDGEVKAPQSIPDVINEDPSDNRQAPIHTQIEGEAPATDVTIPRTETNVTGYTEDYGSVVRGASPNVEIPTVDIGPIAGAAPIDPEVKAEVPQTSTEPDDVTEILDMYEDDDTQASSPTGEGQEPLVDMEPVCPEGPVSKEADPVEQISIPVINVVPRAPTRMTIDKLEPTKEAPESDVVAKRGPARSVEAETAKTGTGAMPMNGNAALPKAGLYDGLKELSDPAPRPKVNYYDVVKNWNSIPKGPVGKTIGTAKTSVTGLMVREPTRIVDEVRDIMVLTDSRLSEDEVEDMVEPDVLMEDDGLTAEFVRLHEEDLARGPVMDGDSPVIDGDVVVDGLLEVVSEIRVEDVSSDVIDVIVIEEPTEISSDVVTEVEIVDEVQVQDVLPEVTIMEGALQADDFVIVEGSPEMEMPPVVESPLESGSEVSIIDVPVPFDEVPTVMFSFGPAANARNVCLTF